jgi:hypothetical protein
MASDQEFQGEETVRFPALMLVGLVMAGVVTIVAWVALGAEFGVPILILVAICAGAAIGYRMLAGSTRREDDASDPIPKQPADRSQPLGATPEAHDDLSPHDLPVDHPARQEVEERS